MYPQRRTGDTPKEREREEEAEKERINSYKEFNMNL